MDLANLSTTNLLPTIKFSDFRSVRFFRRNFFEIKSSFALMVDTPQTSRRGRKPVLQPPAGLSGIWNLKRKTEDRRRIDHGTIIQNKPTLQNSRQGQKMVTRSSWIGFVCLGSVYDWKSVYGRPMWTTVVSWLVNEPSRNRCLSSADKIPFHIQESYNAQGN